MQCLGHAAEHPWLTTAFISHCRSVSVQSHHPPLWEFPERDVTHRFLMDMDYSKPDIPTHEILSIFRAEQQLISQISATAPPISAGF